ncbi:hypothetical protein J6590_008086 [Homalodisca vitripennis]|nr:hypothetical protein J6590_008086 [Homalodisca vitripennis]
MSTALLCFMQSQCRRETYKARNVRRFGVGREVAGLVTRKLEAVQSALGNRPAVGEKPRWPPSWRRTICVLFNKGTAAFYRDVSYTALKLQPSPVFTRCCHVPLLNRVLEERFCYSYSQNQCSSTLEERLSS